MIHINVKEEREHINVPYAPPRSYAKSREIILSFDTQNDYDNFVVTKQSFVRPVFKSRLKYILMPCSTCEKRIL